MKVDNQVKQLKLNVTNIHSFLVSKNKEQRKLKSEKRRLAIRKVERQKLNKEEKILESPVGKSLDKIKDSVAAAPGMSLLDRLIGFGSLILAGILVNALPGIIKEVQDFINNLVSFVTPIYSGFLLLKAVIEGQPLDDPELSPEKKRMSDQVKKLDKEIQKIKKSLGPFEILIRPFELLVDAVFNYFRGDKIVLATKTETDEETGEKKIIEGFKDLETGTFIPRRFTDAERVEYNKARQRNADETDKTRENDNTTGRSYPSGAYIGPSGDRDGQQTGLNMNLPGGIGTPIYAPFDLIYRSVGTDGKDSVGLDGTKDALGPSGKGFGYYGAYRYEKNGKEYEVLMGHFRDLPFRGTEGQVIPKGTLLGYQGASGRSVPGPGNPDPVYPHITLHVNGIGFTAKNSELKSFANKLLKASPTTKIESPGEGGRLQQIKTISQRDPRKRGGSTVIALQRVNTIQTVPYMMPIPTKSRSFSSSVVQLSSIWSE